MFNKLIICSFIALSLLVSACGFQPLYAKRSNDIGEIATTDELLASVSINTIKNREGQILRNLLLDRLNPGNHAIAKEYRLITEISISKSGLGVQSDDTTSRSKLTVTANFQLISDHQTHKFSITQVSGYSSTEEEYPTLVAEQDAIERNLREIANDAKIRIALFLEQDRNS